MCPLLPLVVNSTKLYKLMISYFPKGLLLLFFNKKVVWRMDRKIVFAFLHLCIFYLLLLLPFFVKCILQNLIDVDIERRWNKQIKLELSHATHSMLRVDYEKMAEPIKKTNTAWSLLQHYLNSSSISTNIYLLKISFELWSQIYMM